MRWPGGAVSDTFRDDDRCMPAKRGFDNHPISASNLALLQDYGGVARTFKWQQAWELGPGPESEKLSDRIAWFDRSRLNMSQPEGMPDFSLNRAEHRSEAFLAAIDEGTYRCGLAIQLASLLFPIVDSRVSQCVEAHHLSINFKGHSWSRCPSSHCLRHRQRLRRRCNKPSRVDVVHFGLCPRGYGFSKPVHLDGAIIADEPPRRALINDLDAVGDWPRVPADATVPCGKNGLLFE